MSYDEAWKPTRAPVSPLVAVILFILALAALFSIPLPRPKPAAACRVCHCGEASCHRECGEDKMCAAKCEGLCRKK